MVNSTQLWYGVTTEYGIVKQYSACLYTLESKTGDYGYVSLDGEKVYSYNGEGAWDKVRKEAEMHMYKLDKGV